MTSVSVVLITRNQAWNIERLLASVRHELATLPGSEIVLVDSASTDRTLEIAARYPITAIRLEPEQRLTAAMGRYVGARHTTGDLILFLDGDMELGQGWLGHALRVMQSRPELAVLTGHVIDRPPKTPYDGALVPPPAAGSITAESIPYTGGAALYRRDALEAAGSFHPHVISDEEPDLCIRIRHRGGQIARLGYPIAYHYSQPTEAIPTLFVRWRRNLYLGAGQNLRQHFGKDTFIPYVLQRGFGLIPAVGLLAGLVSFLWYLRTRKWYGLAAWGGLLGLVVVADALRKRSLYRALYSLILRILIADGTIRGFLLPPRDVTRQPVSYRVVRDARLADGA